MTNRNGLYVLNTLQEISQPATYEEIIEAIKKNSYASEKAIRHVVKPILRVGKKLGFIKCVNDHYFAIPCSYLLKDTIGKNTDDIPDRVVEVEHDKTSAHSHPAKGHSLQKNILSKSKSRSLSMSQRSRSAPVNKQHFVNDVKGGTVRQSTSTPRETKKIENAAKNVAKYVKSIAPRSETPRRRPLSKSKSMKLTIFDENESECPLPVTRSKSCPCSRKMLNKNERAGAAQIVLDDMHIQYGSKRKQNEENPEDEKEKFGYVKKSRVDDNIPSSSQGIAAQKKVEKVDGDKADRSQSEGRAHPHPSPSSSLRNHSR